MRRDVCAKALLILGLAAGGYMLPVAAGSAWTGLTSAEAAEFYTRKRVNGRWITGQFPKESSRVERAARASRTAKKGGRAVEEFSVASVPQPPARERGTSALAVSPRSAVPAAEPSPAGTAPPARNEAPAQLVSLQPPAEHADEHFSKLRRALQMRANELAALQAANTTSRTVPVATAPLEPIETGTLPLPAGGAISGPHRDASTGPLRQAPVESAESTRPPKPASAGPLEPKSVSYDFETGIKTTVFESSVVREPFDVSALKSAAGRLPPLR